MVQGTVLIFLLFLLVGCVHSTLPAISVKNGKIFLNNVEFVIKGVDYSPTPLGAASMNANTGFGGGGFCSAKLTPWGDYKSACYDSDYYDGSSDIDPTRFPNGFRPLWERDFPQMKALGINTLRLYNINPSTRAASQTYTNLFAYPQGKDHTQFVKMCEEWGFYLVYPLFADDYEWFTTDITTYKRYLRWQIDEVGNSSAILMWQIGNEMYWSWGNQPDWNAPPSNDKLNILLNYARRYTMSKWDRFIPVMSAAVDFWTDYNYQYSYWQVDILGANVFLNSNTDFDNFFIGATDGSFWGITNLSCRYDKPFLYSEFFPSAGYSPNAFNYQWEWGVAAKFDLGLIGGIWFEQTDEPTLGKYYGFFSVSAAPYNATADSTTPNVIIPDDIAMKEEFWDAFNGTLNGEPFNMNANMFDLIARNPYTFSNVPDWCAETYPVLTCPGIGRPTCSGNGACDRFLGTCTCGFGWTGEDCSIAVCPNACSNNGVCSGLVSPPECVCSYGYYNTSCEVPLYDTVMGTCPNNCTNGNGVCAINSISGALGCQCWPGWAGPDCSGHDFGKGSINIQQYYIGCYAANRTDNFDVVGLSSSLTLTNQNCRYYCAIRNYTYAATESGNSCLCDNVLRTTSTVTSNNCSIVCTGDKLQNCGGLSLNSVYLSGGPLFAGYKGCYMDSNTTRDLPVRLYSGTHNTVDSCRQLCGSFNYTYAGVQEGTDCYCGNTYGNKGGKVVDAQCSTKCAGDTTLFCGATLRNSIYISALPVGYAFMNGTTTAATSSGGGSSTSTTKTASTSSTTKSSISTSTGKAATGNGATTSTGGDYIGSASSLNYSVAVVLLVGLLFVHILFA